MSLIRFPDSAVMNHCTSTNLITLIFSAPKHNSNFCTVTFTSRQRRSSQIVYGAANGSAVCMLLGQIENDTSVAERQLRSLPTYSLPNALFASLHRLRLNLPCFVHRFPLYSLEESVCTRHRKLATSKPPRSTNWA